MVDIYGDGRGWVVRPEEVEEEVVLEVEVECDLGWLEGVAKRTRPPPTSLLLKVMWAPRSLTPNQDTGFPPQEPPIRGRAVARVMVGLLPSLGVSVVWCTMV